MTFEPVVPLWGILLVVALGAGIGWFQYLRTGVYGLSATHRMLLFGLRLATFILVAFLLSNPQWTREVRKERPPLLLVMFDASESMSSAESPESPTAFARLREGFFKTLYPLLQDRFRMRFYTFSSQIYPSDPDKLRETETVGGAATDLRGAVIDALGQQGTNRPAAVAMFTDGNHNWGPDPTSDIFRVEGSEEPIPLIAISTASYGELKKNLAIPQITLPSPVFSSEDTQVRFQVVASGAAGAEADTKMSILFEEEPEVWKPMAGGDQEQKMPLLGSSTQGSFTTQFEKGGKYRVEVEVSAPNLGSASAVREVQVEPGRWKIAYLCGRSGWMSSSLVRRIAYVPRYSMKAAIAHGPRQWSYLATGQGDEEEEESDPQKRYLSLDEIAFGAHLYIFHGLSSEQLAEIPEEAVRKQIEAGAAVLFIAGPGDPPSAGFIGSHGLDPVSPVSFSSAFAAPARKELVFTPEAGSHHVTSSPLILAAQGILPPGFQSYGGLRATEGASTLMEFGTKDPALVVRTVGDNRTAFLGVSDIWRWQFRTGEDGQKLNRAFGALADRLIRWLLMGEEEIASRPRILVSQSRVPLGKSVDIGVQYARVNEEATATVNLVVEDPTEKVFPLALQSRPGGFFQTRYTPPEAGEYTLIASDPVHPEASDTVTLQVEPFSIETAVSGAREDLLRDLAEKTNGAWFDIKDIGQIGRSDRLGELDEPRVTLRTVTEPIMSAPWFLIGLVLLLCLEWTLRRVRDLP